MRLGLSGKRSTSFLTFNEFEEENKPDVAYTYASLIRSQILPEFPFYSIHPGNFQLTQDELHLSKIGGRAICLKDSKYL